MVGIPVPGEPRTEEGDVDMETENLKIALTSLGNEFGAAAARRVASADQLSSDSQRMWSVHMTTPTVMAGLGFRVAQQSEGYPGKANVA